MPSTIKLSENYKSAQKKSIVWIILFIITFIISLLLSVSIFLASLYLGYFLLSEAFNTGTIILSVGACVMGGMIMFFNFKYLLSIFKKTEENGIQIYEEDYPELFKLIKDTADEVGTKHPKKVFLIPDINASVYYSNHIQSLLFPTAKNLNIGIGLVRMTTINELKGVLAHEFGHFSQKSMTIGSYTANAYYVIDEIVNNKESMVDVINTIADFNGFIAIISRGALLYNKLFEKVYVYIFEKLDLQRLALSREMEYHADQIATNVVGIDVMIKPMLRMDLYIAELNKVSRFYASKQEEKKFSKNYYRNLDQVIDLYVANNKIKVKNGLPQPEFEQLNKVYSKLELENIYSTHPELKASIENIRNTKIESEIDNSPIAKVLINDIVKFEENFSFNFFFDLDITRKNEISDEEFLTEFKLENGNSNYPKEYHNLYSYTFLDYKEILDCKIINDVEVINPNELFSEATTDLYANLFAYRDDIQSLNFIKFNKNIKSFKYDGETYHTKDIDELIEKITNEHDNLQPSVNIIDEKIKQFYSQNLTEESIKLAEIGLELNNDITKIQDLKTKIDEKTQFLFVNSHEKIIKEGIQNLHSFNDEIKPLVTKYLDFDNLTQYVNKDSINSFKNYVEDEQIFYTNQYLDYDLRSFFESLNFIDEMSQIILFENKKQFLYTYLSLFNKTPEVLIAD